MILIGGYYGHGDLADEVVEVRELGVAGMKLKVGGASPKVDAERFRTVREVAGDDFLIAADANQAWTRGEAIEFARLIEGLDLLWFEEPCRWDNDRRDLRDVRTIAGVPVCAGQSEYSAGGCRDLFEAGRRRLLQLRRLVVRWPDRVATRSSIGARFTACRWRITRSPRSVHTCWRRSHTALTSNASTPIVTRSGGTSLPIARRSRTVSSG